MITHKIKLYGYTAELVGESQLILGTVDSYGIEQIELEIGGIWSGLVLFATFRYSGTATKMSVDSNGIVEVPPQATQSGNSASTRGKIVFHAVSETQQAISTDIEYRVYQHSDVDGNEPLPPDTSWNQIIAQAGAARDEAVQAASEAKKSLEEIGDSVERAEAAANRAEQVAGDVTSSGSAEIEKIKQAGTNEVNRVKSEGDVQVKRISEEGNAASGYAEQAKKYAEEAAGYVSDVSDAANKAVSDINASKQTAITQIGSSGSEQISNVQYAGNAVIETIESEKNVAVQAVKDAQTTGINAVQTAQTEGVKAVNDAGDAKVEEIEQINSLVPTPTPEDAGKVVVVKPDGTGYELGDVQKDSYTKAESDARYAPIASALKVKCNGTGIGTLTPTVAWRLQSLLIGGRTTQDGTPSPESPAPLANAGRDGELDITITGVNLFNYAELIQNKVYGTDGKLSSATGYMSTPQMPVCPGKPYRVNANNANAFAAIWLQFDRAGNLLSREVSKPSNYTKTLLSNAAFLAITFYSNVNASWLEKAIVSAGAEEVPYTPYQGIQTFPIPTPNGIPGIPVDSGGNWTDESGKQWICDEVDFARGVYVQRVERITFNGSSDELWEIFTNDNAQRNYFRISPEKAALRNNSDDNVLLCSAFPYMRYGYAEPSGDNTACFQSDNLFFACSTSLFGNIDEWTQYLNVNAMTLIYAIANPIETPIPPEEIAAYRALYTYDGTTNIIALDAMVQASAVANSTAIIQQMQEQIATLQSATIGG